MRWDESDTRTFVKLYLSHNCLWDSRHIDYNLKLKREEAHRKISSDFSAASGMTLSEEEVRRKIKSLRATYYLELVKIQTHHRRSTLGWFADFHKCLKDIPSRRAKEEHANVDFQPDVDNGVWVPENETEDTFNEDYDDTSKEDNNSTDPFVPPLNVTDDYVLLKVEPDDGTDRKRQKTVRSRKRKFKRRSPSTDTSDHAFRSTADSSSGSREDEFDIYGKYIASQLRGMDLQRALRVQLQIQNIVSENRIEAVREMNL